MKTKGFKNGDHKKKIHLEVIKNLGGERVFSFEVAKYLINIGYSTTVREVGHYLGRLPELEKERRSGRWAFTLEIVK